MTKTYFINYIRIDGNDRILHISNGLGDYKERFCLSLGSDSLVYKNIDHLRVSYGLKNISLLIENEKTIVGLSATIKPECPLKAENKRLKEKVRKLEWEKQVFCQHLWLTKFFS